MSLLDSFGKTGKMEEKYRKLRFDIGEKAARQSHEMKVIVQEEPYNIAEMLGIRYKSGSDIMEYCDVSNFILSEYPSELGIFVAKGFEKTGLFGKVMVATQYVDEFPGRFSAGRLSFIKEHPKFHEFMTEKHCPERTNKAETLLAEGMLFVENAELARKSFSARFEVPKMKDGARKKLYAMDPELAGYITS